MIIISKRWIKIKASGEPEVDVCDTIRGLDFLGDDMTPVVSNNYQSDTARDGGIFNYTTFSQSVVNANFFLRFITWQEFKMAKNEIYRMFMNRKLMRIRTDTEPYMVKYVRSGNFELPAPQGMLDTTFTVPFDNPSGYKYSLLRSDALHTNADDLWQVGMHIPVDQDVNYHFKNAKTIKVYNPSDIEIDPYYQRHDLQIICKFSGSKLGLTNQTNGTAWNYNAGSSGNDTITLNGISTYKNGTPDSSNTDYGNIVLDKGWNSIVVTGATTNDITFSFPFIYLA